MLLTLILCFFFFFQAEDGIRDFHVTGVQTCALPILPRRDPRRATPVGAWQAREGRRDGERARGGGEGAERAGERGRGTGDGYARGPPVPRPPSLVPILFLEIDAPRRAGVDGLGVTPLALRVFVNPTEERLQLDLERRRARSGLPDEPIARDLRPLVRRPPPLHQPGVEVHDPVLRHALALVNQPLFAAVARRSARR